MPLRGDSDLDQAHKVTHPNQLPAVIANATKIQLVLLQPLADIHTLGRCTMDPEITRDGVRIQYVDTLRLARMWRRALAPLLPQLEGKTIIFDAALPVMDPTLAQTGRLYPYQIFWANPLSPYVMAGIHVWQVGFKRMALALLTAMNMKTSGRLKSFAVWDETPRDYGRDLDGCLTFDGLDGEIAEGGWTLVDPRSLDNEWVLVDGPD